MFQEFSMLSVGRHLNLKIFTGFVGWYLSIIDVNWPTDTSAYFLLLQRNNSKNICQLLTYTVKSTETLNNKWIEPAISETA